MKDAFKNFRYMSLMLLILAGVSAAAGQSPQSAAPGPPAGFSGDPIRQLNLTPEQREQIRLIREQNRDERFSTNQRVRETNRALAEVLDADSPDQNAVDQRLQEAGAAQAAAMRLRILTELKIRRVLTPEQRTLLRSLRRGVHEARNEGRMEGRDERRKRRQDNALRMREQRRNPRRNLLAAPPQNRPNL